MFESLINLTGNIVKTAVNIVEIPVRIVDKTIVKPIADATEAVKETVDDLTD